MAEPGEAATLRALLRAPRPRAAARGRRLGASRTRRCGGCTAPTSIDPTPFLSEGLVLLTTGTQFVPDAAHPDADSPEAYDAYVRRLHARGVAGLGFGTEVVRDGIPPLLADACARHGIPLFEVPYRTPFIAVARANAEAIAAEAYARRSWALAAQRAISLAALRPGRTGREPRRARPAARHVGRPLRHGRGARPRVSRTASSRRTSRDELAREAVAVLRGGARAASSIRIAGHAFTLQTLGRGGHLRGVMAIASEGLDQAARGVVTSVIAMAGSRARADARPRAGPGNAASRTACSRCWRMILGSPAAWRASCGAGCRRRPFVVGLATDVGRSSDAVAAFLDAPRRRTTGSPVFFGRGDEGLVVCVEADDVGLIEELAAAFGLTVGVSEPAGYDAFSRAYREARLAAADGPGASPGSRTSRGAGCSPLARGRRRPRGGAGHARAAATGTMRRTARPSSRARGSGSSTTRTGMPRPRPSASIATRCARASR